MHGRNTVYIVDDDAIIRKSLALVLTEAGFSPHPFVSGEDFVEALDYLENGCVLLDMHMPGLSGYDVLENLQVRKIDMPLVVMTSMGDIPMAVRSIKTGALDFIEKPIADDLLFRILRVAFDYLDAAEARREDARSAAARLEQLTPRERDVLSELCAGRPNKQIAFEMGLSVRTVEMHRGNIMHKLGIHSTAEALKLVMASGIDLKPA